ncbi:LTA synthase family protein [Paenibacillus protaetiae]|uniref:LTA synthase family protein n=1 Tax=Paenibacillus protaetiae TaxID=2509456 RepID=A0A4P6EVM9_9BACL|nr:LTA synthase family protein [Paenibacillus protaetiae]QAY65739.1 LTA synthase family protein [Paenibacillus protaetiae]
MFGSRQSKFSAGTILFFSVSMLLKCYFAWHVLFEDGPSLETIIREIPIILVIFCAIEWFATRRKLLYYLIVNLVISILYLSLIMYYEHYGIIATFHVLGQMDQAHAVQKSIFSLIHPVYFILFIDFIVLAFMFIRKQTAKKWLQVFNAPSSRKLILGVFSVSIILCALNIFPNSASMNETVKAEQMGLLSYEAYTLLADKQPDPVPFDIITQEGIDKLKGITETANPVMFGAAKGKNLIIVQMESFQDFLINLKVDGQEITPNLNRLANEGFHFTNFYQAAGQGNTSDAEYAVNTSFYVPAVGTASQVYANKDLPSMPKLLEANGYDTATFHTNEVHFWNRDDLYQALGFNRYYDKNFFGEDHSLYFGSTDDILYAKTTDELQKMDQSDKPFYAQLISMSGHHPFTIPEDWQTIKLPDRYKDTYVGNYLTAQNYADYCFGQLIDELKAKGLWDDSLLVVYGDHRGMPLFSLQDKDMDLLNELGMGNYSDKKMLNIPLIISSPGVTHPAVMKQLGGQTDIFPTVANLLGVSMKDHIHFGQDLLNQDKYNLVPISYYLPTGSFFNNNGWFIPGTKYDDGTQYSYSTELPSTTPVTTEDEFNRVNELRLLSHSYVGQLPDRTENKTQSAVPVPDESK